MTSERDFAKFFLQLSVFLVVGALLSILFVLVVDPYRLYQWVDKAGVNHVKPHPDRYAEEIKFTGVQANRASAWILGNSRAEIGLDPAYRGFPERGLSAYNLAIAGSGMDVLTRQFERLHSAGKKPELIIFGAEFLDFLVDPSRPGIAYKQLAAREVEAPLTEKLDALFSLQSLTDAVKTLQIQRRPETETLTERGFNPLLEYNKYAREQGYHALFQQRAEENAKNYLNKRGYTAVPKLGKSLNMGRLHAILMQAASDKTELHLFIYPYHAQILSIFEQLGLWPAFEEWKALLAEEVAQVKKDYPDARISLWDFSGFSTYQCEAIPGKNEKTKTTQWYWEAGHFKPALGNLMLARMLDPQQQPVGPAIGYPLTTADLEADRQRIEAEKQACMAAYPGLFAETTALVNKARQSAK